MYFRHGRERITVTHLRKPIVRKQLGLIGFFQSNLFDETVSIIIDYRPKESANYDFACAASDSNGNMRVLMEPEVFLDFIRGKPYARTTVLHELGHICNKDLAEVKQIGTDSYDQERLYSLKEGKIHEWELQADRFAVRFLGKEIVCQGLDELKARLLNRYTAEDGELSISELSQRIQVIEALP